MTLIWLFLLQASPQLPDIEIGANVRARSVTVAKQGDARLTVSTSPAGDNLVAVRAPKANGRKTLRNVEVKVRAEARIGDPFSAVAENRKDQETAPPN